MKTVGKRNPSRGTLEDAGIFLKLVVGLIAGNETIPKGVYRFKTHQEANDWSKNPVAAVKKK